MRDVIDAMPDADVALLGVRALLRLAGRDPDEPGIVDTPARVLRAWSEQTSAPGDPAQLLAVQFPDAAQYDQMIAVGPVPFASVCEHHLLPFTGHAWVAYIPNGKGVVGLSKLARLVEHYARRPQIQERLTAQIADALVEHLDPVGAGCVVRASHTCMTLRGVRKDGALMTTSAIHGELKDQPAARAEFMALVGLGP
jgi:GTP cyclohydrolase I